MAGLEAPKRRRGVVWADGIKRRCQCSAECIRQSVGEQKMSCRPVRRMLAARMFGRDVNLRVGSTPLLFLKLPLLVVLLTNNSEVTSEFSVFVKIIQTLFSVNA